MLILGILFLLIGNVELLKSDPQKSRVAVLSIEKACTGVLITRDSVLTAASCVSEKKMKVLIGLKYPKLLGDEKAWLYKKNVTRVNIHPSYTKNRLAMFDFAVLRFSEIPSGSVQPIRLLHHIGTAVKKESCTVSGFTFRETKTGKQVAFPYHRNVNSSKLCPCTPWFVDKKLHCVESTECFIDPGAILHCSERLYGIGHVAYSSHLCSTSSHLTSSDKKRNLLLSNCVQAFMSLCGTEYWFQDIFPFTTRDFCGLSIKSKEEQGRLKRISCLQIYLPFIVFYLFCLILAHQMLLLKI